ncbi:MAG: metallophosphoesterase family protein [Clostridia bacterium]|nr:metallophosphoesterase family protein [Clostridia bacterium]
MKIAILSDTHDLLRPEVLSLLPGCDCILHGGDVSSQRILDQIAQFAPVKAVRGNNDKEWAEELPLYLDFELGGLRMYMTHKKKDLPKDLLLYDIVILGHSHQYSSTWVDYSGMTRRTLLLNPGSCGPRRFHQPITLAMLTIEADGWQVKRIEIPHAPKEAAPKVDPKNIKQQIEIVMKETQKGNGVTFIAEKYGMDKTLVEQIARLYVTHPGVTADGIMTKMGV